MKENQKDTMSHSKTTSAVNNKSQDKKHDTDSKKAMADNDDDDAKIKVDKDKGTRSSSNKGEK